ncbi:MAG: UDP-N-acetylenolpyruvoylglucosamine reductase [Candidatus Zambryskibacteria bacterium RIFCSPHIGHO2_02_FULL_43_14]|uniref:UDP-N-acetylenolpyruvoylglucosamine reductase n=1 Tax=Candidatus Zambryskibacteria bacterium RIFCSPHIGHO2_02_FULL_43_14 TaxID=1802748 RepID=A0A1G2TFQ2_9BACT|nr:MAG: UDP-N-acetylenolpyruvoylglucosamine reductase [Candidatus Zambryskibacteria bacterium RIFCSPHIGHO2_01_FULL_43_60]OHA96135.1 MAG: UDP-N-acetylenolpyruvoylglucosamine reductase [Candidatus Zambryskibacteria bacterium RIFCSPHIGHO2_02_FULL_43_14]OHB03135.1 MAG: UDP-N-acetylenolpyruvoylglucosamine reductase [Candidatus Zambryskibacteria bacterium RIFCSPLOWO2_01_FULL_42_41]
MLNLRDIKSNVSLAPYTTYKIGGKADYFFTARNKTDLIFAIKEAKTRQISIFILGTGANILVGDKGFRGLVIHNKTENIKFDINFLIAESGAVVSDLIDACVEKGLSGLEHFAGIPSSVGGAIRQNLHFLSPDRRSTIFIESVVKEGLVLEKGKEMRVGKEYFRFGYDDSILHHDKDVFVLEITFELEKRDRNLIKNQIEENLKWRNEKQPQLWEFPSCGSVFKKIEGIGAGRLIDKCGLKGKQIGGACVSEKHANYIVNMGKATAENVRDLINIVQKTVLEQTGFKLEPEIDFIGEF